MKTALHISALILLGGALQLYFPWWSLAVAAFLLALWFPFAPREAFLAAFLGAALLWGGYAGYINVLNDGILAGKMGELFGVSGAWTTVLLSALFGGLFGGLGAWTGSLAKQAFFSSEKVAAE